MTDDEREFLHAGCRGLKCGPAPLGETLERIVAVLSVVPPQTRDLIKAAMKEADFQVIFSGAPQLSNPDASGAAVAMTIPVNGSMPAGLMPILLAIGYPQAMPTSMTPLLWDRVRAFWEFGNAPVRGELATKERIAAGATP